MNNIDINKIQDLSKKYIQISNLLIDEYSAEFESSIYSDALASVDTDCLDELILKDKSFNEFICQFKECTKIEQMKILQETQLEDSFNVLSKIYSTSLQKGDIKLMFSLLVAFLNCFISNVIFDKNASDFDKNFCPLVLSDNENNTNYGNAEDEDVNTYLNLFFEESSDNKNLFYVLQSYTIYFDNLFNNDLFKTHNIFDYVGKNLFYKLLFIINLSIYLDHVYYFDLPNDFQMLKKRKYRDLLDTIAEFSLRTFKPANKNDVQELCCNENILLREESNLNSLKNILEVTNVVAPIYFAEISKSYGNFELKYDAVIYNIVNDETPLINKLTILNSLELMTDSLNVLDIGYSIFKVKEKIYSVQINDYVLQIFESVQKGSRNSKMQLSLIEYILKFIDIYKYNIASKIKDELNNII